MGNVLNKAEEKNEIQSEKKEIQNEDKEIQNEDKEILETEEIPPDTQINKNEQENLENEINSEEQNKVIQQNIIENEIPKIQEEGGENALAKEALEQNAEIEEQIGEEAENNINNDEEGKEGEGVEIQQTQQYQEYQQPNKSQINQEEQAYFKGQEYEFIQDGELYKVNQNGQIYKVVQVQEDAQGMGVYPMNQAEEIQIAQPIYQNIGQNQQIQEVNLKEEMQENKALESYQENIFRNAGPQIPQILSNRINNEQYLMKIKNSPMDQTQHNSRSPISKNSNSNYYRKAEPKDSNPKIHIISNTTSRLNIQNQNSNSYMNLNTNKYMKKNLSNKNYTFINKSERNMLKANQNNIKNIKSFSKLNLRDNSGFVDIPRKDYENYVDRETLIINDGMDTGEYKFIGAKTVLIEKEVPNDRRINISEEEIRAEINKRNKEKKEKVISYEIVDKFYALTEIRGKTIKRVQKNLEGINKKNFYGGIKSNITTNYNINENINNFGSNFSQNNSQTTNLKGMNIESDTFKVYISKNGQSKNEYFKTSAGGKGIMNSGSNNYYEIKQNITMGDKSNSKMNYSNFNNANSITFMPTDNYSRYLLEQINRIREDPQAFIGVIEDAKANIIKDRFGRTIYNGKIKIALSRGEAAFNEAIEYLKKINPMDSLEYISYITVIPPQTERDIKDKDDLNRKVTDMINGGINIKSYWRDVIKDPEISFLLMIVDDNGIKSGMRRRDILNPNLKFIGISSVEINKEFVCYITLSS